MQPVAGSWWPELSGNRIELVNDAGSFAAQRYHRIDAGAAACRQPAGKQGYGEEQCGDEGKAGFPCTIRGGVRISACVSGSTLRK